MKWWAIKIIVVLLAIKIIWSNIHLLFRRSDKPVVIQSSISQETELQLKQMEKEIL